MVSGPPQLWWSPPCLRVYRPATLLVLSTETPKAMENPSDGEPEAMETPKVMDTPHRWRP